MPACYLDLSKLGKTSWTFSLAHIGTQNEAGWWLGLCFFTLAGGQNGCMTYLPLRHEQRATGLCPSLESMSPILYFCVTSCIYEYFQCLCVFLCLAVLT